MEQMEIVAPGQAVLNPFDAALQWVSIAIEGTGVAAIVLAALTALIIALRVLLSAGRTSDA